MPERTPLERQRILAGLHHDIAVLRREQKLQKERKKSSRKSITMNDNPTATNEQKETPPLTSPTQQTYCDFRPKGGSNRQSPYRPQPAGRPCTCSTPHPPLHPRDWEESPAEADWNYDLPHGGHPARTAKVAFADELVTEVRYFDRWYKDEYERSDRYGPMGPTGTSMDPATELDDDVSVAWDDAMDILEKSGVVDEWEIF